MDTLEPIAELARAALEHGTEEQAIPQVLAAAERLNDPLLWQWAGLLNRSLDVDRTTAFADEAAAQEIAMTSEDAAEGVRSFVERRPPQFRGW